MVGIRWFKTTHQLPESLQQEDQSFQGVKYVGHDAHAKELPPLLLQQPVRVQKAPNVNLWQPANRDTHTRWEHLQVICAIYPDGTKIPVTQLDVVEKSHTGWKDAKYHKRQKSVEIGAPIVQAPQLSESDSPQVPKALDHW